MKYNVIKYNKNILINSNYLNNLNNKYVHKLIYINHLDY